MESVMDHAGTDPTAQRPGAAEQRAAEPDAPATGARDRPKAGMLTVAQYKDRLWRRLFRTLDYVSIAFSILMVYGAALVADYLLIYLIEYLFRDEIAESSFVASFFHAVRVGLALLTFILALIHGVRSAVEQYRLDSRLTREDEKPHV
jgi:hypothetical protein